MILVSMDQVVILWPRSVSEKRLLNCLDMKCGLDEGLEQKTSLYIKHSLSQSRRTFVKSGKLTSPTAPLTSDSQFSEKDFQETGFEGGEIVEPELEISAESKSKSSPNKAKFIQNMVDRFDWHEHCADDRVVCQKMNKGSVPNCGDAELIKETVKIHGRSHSKSENSAEIVSSGRKLPASKSSKPSPAPKPRNITKDKSLYINNSDESTFANREVEPTKHGSEKLCGGIASSGSCTDVSNSAPNSALCMKSMTSLSRSCGNLKQNESSGEFKDSSLSQPRSEESSADESAEEIVADEGKDWFEFGYLLVRSAIIVTMTTARILQVLIFLLMVDMIQWPVLVVFVCFTVI